MRQGAGLAYAGYHAPGSEGDPVLVERLASVLVQAGGAEGEGAAEGAAEIIALG
jgi:hypothetical protein